MAGYALQKFCLFVRGSSLHVVPKHTAQNPSSDTFLYTGVYALGCLSSPMTDEYQLPGAASVLRNSRHTAGETKRSALSSCDNRNSSTIDLANT